tara:strand:+ start:520 stop:786 length:267 start_codon:yes stop_codon:yes gene_type:complete
MKTWRVLDFYKRSLTINDSRRKWTIWRNNLKTLENLITKAKSPKGLSWSESIDLAQWLIDTEKRTEYPEYEKLCDYYIEEGLCYYVPS